MALPQQLKFVELTSEFFNLNNDPTLKVLEIGSYIVNGTVRPYFALASQYIGVDLMPGPGVDIVSNGEDINLPDENFDIAISCECFEHNPHWVKSFQSMYEKIKKGGILIASCASRGRLEHGTKRTSPESSPGTQSIEWNYYKNLTKKDFNNKLNLDDLFSSYIFVYNGTSKDLYFVGLKLGENSKTQELPLADLKSQLKNIDSLFPKSKTTKLLKTYGVLQGAPLYIASFLPDNAYQNFALPYARFIHNLRVGLGKLFGV
jgi:SAM-dependent methyltransferase